MSLKETETTATQARELAEVKHAQTAREKEETVSFPTPSPPPHPFSFTFFLIFSLCSFALAQLAYRKRKRLLRRLESLPK